MARNPKKDPLNEAIACWRDAAPDERFSREARADILERSHRARREPGPTRLAQLFVPVAKIAYASAVPVLVLALTLGWLAGTTGQDVGPVAVRIETSKVGGEAVFRIANGGRLHKVYRTSDPRGRGEMELLATTKDSFSDRLYETTGVVYYRID